MLPSKVCAGCGERKPWCEYHAHRKWDDGTMRTPKSQCKRCMNARTQEQRRAGKWRNPQTHTDYSRRYYRDLMADPERAAIRRDQQREARRTRANVPPSRFRTSRYMRGHEPPVLLMAAPFADWVSHVMARDDATMVELAARWGLSDTTLYKLRSGRRETVELATVEAALTADGTCLVSDLYDDQELAA